MMALKDKPLSEYPEDIEWNVEYDNRLFESMINLKPVGTHRHFHMACIIENFTKAINKVVRVETIWKHLETMYDLEALHEIESLTLKNNEQDFMLPTSEYMVLMNNKIKSELEDKSAIQKNQAKVKVEITPTPKLIGVLKRDDKVLKVASRRDSASCTKETTPKRSTTPKNISKSESDKKNSIQKSRSRKISEVGTPSSSNRVGRSTRGSVTTKPEDISRNTKSPIPSAKRRRTRNDAD